MPALAKCVYYAFGICNRLQLYAILHIVIRVQALFLIIAWMCHYSFTMVQPGSSSL
jgi:hypothetical protein